MTEPGYIPPPVIGWWVKKNMVLFPAPATLRLIGGTPSTFTPVVTAPTAASLTLTGATPVTTMAPAIALVSSSSGNGNTITMPTHATGDRLLMWAFRGGSIVAPTPPAGWTSVVIGGGSGCSGLVGTKVAASSSETSGTWTNATQLIVLVYRNVSSIGAFDMDTGAANNFVVPGLTLNQRNGTSWVVTFTGTSVVGQTWPVNTGNGYPLRESYEGIFGQNDIAAYHTNHGVSSFPADIVTYGGSSPGFQTAAVELVN